MSANPFPIKPEPGICQNCFGLGVISVTYLHDSFKTLMRCECAEGKLQDYALPLWEWRASKIFDRRPVDVSDFKPRPGEFSWPKISEIMKTWRQQVKWAEQHWQQQKANA